MHIEDEGSVEITHLRSFSETLFSFPIYSTLIIIPLTSPTRSGNENKIQEKKNSINPILSEFYRSYKRKTLH